MGLVSRKLFGGHHSHRVDAFGLQFEKVLVLPLVDLHFQIYTKLGYPHYPLPASRWVVLGGWGFVFRKLH